MDTLALLPRLFGFFLLSPLFSWLRLPFFLRFALALLFAFLLSPFVVAKMLTFSDLVMEVAVGYLIGFAFALLFEALALGGELVGTMSGFSATHLFSPFGQLSLPLLSRLFVLLGITLFFTLDLHHLVLRVLFESFHILPIGFSFDLKSEAPIATLSSLLFQQALTYALLPMILLFLFLLFLALAARLFPEFNFLSIGFPLQLLLGFVALTLLLTHFPEAFYSSFSSLKTAIEKILLDSTHIP